MLDFLIDSINTKSLAMVSAAIAAAATVLTVAMPLLAVDSLGRRMKTVALEREKIRQRERERLAQSQQKARHTSARQSIQAVVERFNLKKWFGQEEARLKLVKIGLCIAAAYSGMHLPLVILKNKIQRRQLSIRRAFPDSLDLLLICVESGMSIETAFKKVSDEVGSQSVALAEELMLTTAELSYLPDRRQAYDNLAQRTDLEGVKSVCMALQQAERYGTPLAHMLRVMAQENRDMRMAEAEKKAAGLPPKLTVPMILFFLPVLLIVILGPSAIKVMALR